MPANATGLTAPPIFRREALDPSELEAFTQALERDGFVLFDGCLTEDGAEGLAAEMLPEDPVAAKALLRRLLVVAAQQQLEVTLAPSFL